MSLYKGPTNELITTPFEEGSIVMPGQVDKIEKKLKSARKNVSDITLSKYTQPKKVFVSFPFEHSEHVAPLIDELKRHGVEVVTGEYVASDINRGIKKKLSGCHCLLSIMFRETETVKGAFFPAVWLIEEKVVAWMLDIPVVLLVERGVEYCGEMHGNTQRVVFDAMSFWAQSLNAIKIVKVNLDDVR